MNEFNILVNNQKKHIKIKSEIKEYSNIFKLSTYLDRKILIETNLEYNKLIDEEGFIAEDIVKSELSKIIK